MQSRQSPFEWKNRLKEIAKQTAQEQMIVMLNAGRGNPNWLCTLPRAAFFLLGQIALMMIESENNQETSIAWQESIKYRHENFDQQLSMLHEGEAGRFLQRVMKEAKTSLGIDEDTLIDEWVRGILGDQYPQPVAMLTQTQKFVTRYLYDVLGLEKGDRDSLNVFAVEGATAGMVYVFNTLFHQGILQKGDRIAMMVPIFAPYLEMLINEDFGVEIVTLYASLRDEQGQHLWQFPDEELEKIMDPSIRVLCLVNPSNPPSVAMRTSSLQKLQQVVEQNRPDLMIITDDVYAPFVEDYQSIMAYLPQNTVCIYSFSKFFGVTGWRLGVIAMDKDNVFDRNFRLLPKMEQEKVAQAYEVIASDPEKLTFFDRLIADSRDIALRHTAGLSTPQQIQMMLLCAFANDQQVERYKLNIMTICKDRMRKLYDGLALPIPDLPHCASYYTEFDLLAYAKKKFTASFLAHLERDVAIETILMELARVYAIILLPGQGFGDARLSIRVSLSNLKDDDYTKIGQALFTTLARMEEAWGNKR